MIDRCGVVCVVKVFVVGRVVRVFNDDSEAINCAVELAREEGTVYVIKSGMLRSD